MPKEEKKPLNLKYFVTTRKFLLVSIGLSCLSIFIFFSFIFPKVQSIQEYRKELEDEQAKLQQLQDKLNILENVNSIDAFSERDRIDTILPSQKPLFSLLQKFEALAQNNNVVISSFNLSPGEISTESADTKKKSSKAEKETLQALEIEAAVVGEVTDLNAFLRAVDNLSPITDVTKISFTPAKGIEDLEEASSIFEADLSLSTYYYTGKPEAQVDQELPTIETLDKETLDTLTQFDIADFPQPVVTDDGFEATPGAKKQLFE